MLVIASAFVAGVWVGFILYDLVAIYPIIFKGKNSPPLGPKHKGE